MELHMNNNMSNLKMGAYSFFLLILKMSLMFLLLWLSLLPISNEVIYAQETPEADDPDTNLLQNPDFELGNSGWQFLAGGGIEDCCGQHETPFWGRQSSPYPSGAMFYIQDTWDGYIFPNGQFSRIYQWKNVRAKKYRLSVWLMTNGMTGTVRLYFPSSNTYVTCGSTSSIEFVPVICEFTPAVREDVAFILEGNAAMGSGKWVVSDDWSLNRVLTPTGMSRWSALPVKYYVDSNAYPTRTRIGTGRWNTAMGKQMFVETTDLNQAQIRFTAGYRGFNSYYGGFYSNTNRIDLNKSFLDLWIDPPYRYGFEGRESIVTHESGHALGLNHQTNNSAQEVENCDIMTGAPGHQYFYCANYLPDKGDIAGMRAIYP